MIGNVNHHIMRSEFNGYKLVDELGGMKSGGGSGTRTVGANGSVIGDELSEAEEGILATSAYPYVTSK